jgi:toxin CcdB
MAQFDVYANPIAASTARIPFLLELQNDLLGGLTTTVVVPLYDAGAITGPAIRDLTPVLEVDQRSVVMMTPELAGLDRKRLARPIGDLRHCRSEIIAALDILFTGI